MREHIRSRLIEIDDRRTLQADHGLASDHDLNAPPPAAQICKPAAVLVPLIEYPGELHVLLTRRTDHLHDHAGQVSFPGGRMEAVDAGDAINTALRETEEEIGLDRAHIDPIGFLDRYQTRTGFLVTPVVGMIRPGFELTLDRFEVAEAFEVPLAFLLDEANRRIQSYGPRESRRRYYTYEYESWTIWGATAGMIANLASRVEA